MLQKFTAKFAALAMALAIVAAPLASPVAQADENEATLKVALNTNLDGAGFVILDTGNDNKLITSEKASNCAPLGTDYVCTYKLPTGSYIVQYKYLKGYTTPKDSPALLTASNKSMVVRGDYVKQENKKLNVAMNINDDGAGFVVLDTGNGNKMVKSEDASNCPSNGTDYVCTFTDLPTGSYIVEYKYAKGYTTPKDSPALLSEQYGDMTVRGDYLKSEKTLSVGVNINEDGAGFEILDTGNDNVVIKTEEAKNCTLADDDYYTCDYDLPTGSYIVQYTDADGYTTPKDSPALLSEQYGDMKVTGDYVKTDGDTATLKIDAEDQDGDSLVVDITVDALATQTPKTVVEDLDDLDNYTITFKNEDNCTAPGSVTINDQKVSTLPSGITLTEDGSTYTLGTAFKDGSTYKFVGTYDCDDTDDMIDIDKQVIKKTAKGDGNYEIDYRITVTRNNNGPSGAVEVEVEDTISGKNYLSGDNGGKLLPQGNGECSDDCGDILDGPVTIELDKGETVYLDYTLLSDINGIPNGETSSFENTAISNYEDDGSGADDEEDKSSETVNIDGDQDEEGELTINVTSTQDTAKRGDCPVYTITAVNNTGQDLTGAVISWDYDENALDVTDTFGGTDNGSVVTWTHGDLDEDQSASYKARACVTENAAPGSRVTTTARILVNELTDTPTDDHTLMIDQEPVPTTPDPGDTGVDLEPTVPALPSSGAAGNILLLLLASGLGYAIHRKTRKQTA